MAGEGGREETTSDGHVLCPGSGVAREFSHKIGKDCNPGLTLFCSVILDACTPAVWWKGRARNLSPSFVCMWLNFGVSLSQGPLLGAS